MSWLIKLAGGVTGNPMLLIWIAAGAFGLGALTGAVPAWKVQGWRLDAVQARFDGFVGQTELIGKQAEKEAEAVKALHQQTLEDVSNAWKKQLQPARDGAVAAYRAAHPERVWRQDSGCGIVPGNASGNQGNDGGGKEPVAAGQTCEPDAKFIEDSAQDALSIGIWRTWAVKNKLPVK